MYFRYPTWTIFFLALAFLVFLYLWSAWQRRRDLKALGEWRLISRLIPVAAVQRRKRKDILALLAFFFLIIAATGPQFGTRLKEIKHRGINVFIAVDTSRSMLAEDVPPNRLERAKRSLGLLIRKLEGNRVGIIAFAKFAVIQCPLTTDVGAAKMFLEILDTNTVPEQGTAVGDAIRLALKGLPEDNRTGKAIVILTDGEDHRSDPIGAAQMAKEQGTTIFTIGIGTSKGEVIKKKDEAGKVVEFLKYKGEMVLSRLDDGLLTKIATITGGRYYRASSTDVEIDEIADILNGYEKSEISAKLYERYEERYQIFLLIALLLFILEFFLAERPGQAERVRSKWLALPIAKKLRLAKVASLFMTAVLMTGSAQANVKDHIMLGNKLLKKGDHAGARAEFESAQLDAPDEAFIPYNIGTTYYLEGNFDEAKRHYEMAKMMATNPSIKAQAAYNLGHVLFHMGKSADAIESFKDCLKLDPNDKDAKYNIEYIRAGKKPKSPPQQKKNQQDKGEGKEKNEQDKSEQGDGQSQEQNQTKQDQNNSDRENADRVLEMIQEEEEKGREKAVPLRMGDSKKDRKEEVGREDW